MWWRWRWRCGGGGGGVGVDSVVVAAAQSGMIKLLLFVSGRVVSRQLSVCVSEHAGLIVD